MIYLAIPYTGQEEFSFSLATAIAAELTARGEVVYSPITHSHPMTKVKDLPGDWEFWEKVDREFISACDKMYVVCADGWEESTGVQAEIKIATFMGLDISCLHLEYKPFRVRVSSQDIRDFYISNRDLDF